MKTRMGKLSINEIAKMAKKDFTEKTKKQCWSVAKRITKNVSKRNKLNS